MPRGAGLGGGSVPARARLARSLAEPRGATNLTKVMATKRRPLSRAQPGADFRSSCGSSLLLEVPSKGDTGGPQDGASWRQSQGPAPLSTQGPGGRGCPVHAAGNVFINLREHRGCV